MAEQEKFESVVETVLTFLFDEFERLSLWNAAYRHAVLIGGDPTELRTMAEQFAARDQYPRGIEKYSDLRHQAIQSVRDHNPDEFAALVPQLKARFAAWDGIQGKTK